MAWRGSHWRHDHRLPRPLHDRAQGVGKLAQPADRGHRRPIADAVEKREANEAGKRERFTAGELGLDMYAMRESLAKAGLRYIETTRRTSCRPCATTWAASAT
ncbi:hypothetical protein A8M77_03910 [Variovorax sp. JS1663]|nr:hypothetical protein A8M77_03910 [Variovorax sp. JS1663]